MIPVGFSFATNSICCTCPFCEWKLNNCWFQLEFFLGPNMCSGIYSRWNVSIFVSFVQIMSVLCRFSLWPSRQLSSMTVRYLPSADALCSLQWPSSCCTHSICQRQDTHLLYAVAFQSDLWNCFHKIRHCPTRRPMNHVCRAEPSMTATTTFTSCRANTSTCCCVFRTYFPFEILISATSVSIDLGMGVN